ncbi:MAG: CoA transferase [Chloroflexi bacterium]|nr:CoA transferase [Chloroflexota bacterium]
MAGALEGIRIIDWTQWQQGPQCTMLLADLGADVIKIEDRITGDPGRGAMVVGGHRVADNLKQRNPYFEIGNRNKRSLKVDLKKEAGRELIYRLVEQSDIFVHNYRSGAAERLGMDYETLSKYNSRLIYAHCTGWGEHGPDKDARAFDSTGLARSGFWSMLIHPDGEAHYPPVQIADGMGAITTAFAVLAAVVHRQRTGEGQKVSGSILGGMSYLLTYPLTIYTLGGSAPTFISRNQPFNPLYSQYKCQDGRWLALILIPPDQHWPNFCQVMGLQELESDPRFNNMEARSKNTPDLVAILDERFATQPSQTWERLLREKDMPVSRINTVAEFSDDPQAIANDYVIEYDHSSWGRIKTAGFPISMTRTPCSVRREAPEFGQHTEEILLELLGYDWDHISRLKEDEVI